ncbi:hypothetical protein Glove_486g9 [Diversispora epigaea]|uniref:Uncharacterized protein n=1 Tax=Diversispora epigaea TaxID=1348612 RepID=A0A397GMP2_9GLOM|nr:hypothetical protein Glove_486g9 [Diversispora epigaea]
MWCRGLSDRVISKIAQICPLEFLSVSGNSKGIKRASKLYNMKDTTLYPLGHCSAIERYLEFHGRYGGGGSSSADISFLISSFINSSNGRSFPYFSATSWLLGFNPAIKTFLRHFSFIERLACVDTGIFLSDMFVVMVSVSNWEYYN